MDAGLDENEAELAVLVLAVALKVLADGDGLQKMSEYMSFFLFIFFYDMRENDSS